MMNCFCFVQAFNGHRGAVTGLAFRQGTQELMSSSMDRCIKLWSVEDRSYIDTVFGHQSDVIAIDCLRQERILSAGRDRTLRLFKVQFRATYISYSVVYYCGPKHGDVLFLVVSTRCTNFISC